MPGTPEVGLDGGGVLITRPEAQVGKIRQTVEALAGVAYVFPTLEIKFTPAQQLVPRLLDIQAEDIMIFVSVNAVGAVFESIDSVLYQRLSKVNIAAVGARTRQVLLDLQCKVNIVPQSDQQNSEGLLQHPALQHLQGRRVFIMRAQSGRDTLRDELQQRGASVTYIQAYQRGIPGQFDAQPILDALASKAIEIVMLTSYDAFSNLMKMLGESGFSLLKEAQIIVPSRRVAQKIQAVFSLQVNVAENASDEAMLAQARLLLANKG